MGHILVACPAETFLPLAPYNFRSVDTLDLLSSALIRRVNMPL